jgi:hypothetical protein
MKHFYNNGKEYLKKDDNWDPNDWQGRSRQQDESSAWAITITLMLAAIMGIYKLIITIF